MPSAQLPTDLPPTDLLLTDCRTRRSAHAAWPRRFAAAALGAIAVMAVSAAPVLAEDDEDDVSFEQGIIRKLLGQDQPNIEYRERSPLVIPPSQALPPPESTGSVARTPAWPNDPDEARRRRTSGGREPAFDRIERESKLLSLDELRRGTRRTRRSEEPVVTLSDSQMGRPLTPAELGETKSVFGGLFSRSSGEKSEAFTGEPPRARLIDPPTGYRTPVGNQPYAAPKDTGAWYKPFSWFDRGISKDR